MNESFSEQNCKQSSFESFCSNALRVTLQENTYFTLPDQVVSSLDILPRNKVGNKPDAPTTRANTSVFSVLNNCRTSTGPKLLALWLKNPLNELNAINMRLDVVEYISKNTELRSMMSGNHLRKMPDVLKVSFMMASRHGTKVEDLVKVFRAHESMQNIVDAYKRVIGSDGEKEVPSAITRLFTKAEQSSELLKPLIKHIDDSIYVDKVDAEGHYMIKPGSDCDMAKVYLELESITKNARQQMSHVASDIGLEVDKTIKLEADKDKGFAFKISRQKEQLVREDSNYTQVTTVKKDGFRFATKALKKLSDKYTSAKAEYESLSRGAVRDIIEKSLNYQSEVQDYGILIALFDVFTSLAVAAANGNFNRPLMLPSGEGKIRLDSMRHPCLENQPHIENYVPNDVLFSKDTKKFYMITGPNMGGKSTFIKGVAISVVMAQCGSLVPADSSTISLVDGVYTRVGAGDRQMDGISTFMEEMLDMSEILKSATEHSLVVIDELGRGTSTFDGFGLSWAISQKLAKETLCYTLFATHFHELTELEQLCPLVGNLHVKAICDNDNLIMLYNIEKGVCNESYGINVARYTKFPERIVNRATEKLKEYEEKYRFKAKNGLSHLKAL